MIVSRLFEISGRPSWAEREIGLTVVAFVENCFKIVENSLLRVLPGRRLVGVGVLGWFRRLREIFGSSDLLSLRFEDIVSGPEL